MKQEEKELLIKDLCGRLPYGVRCSFGVDEAIYEVCGINPSSCGASEIQATHVKSSINGDFKLTSCKPYLFPLSSMTEEQYCDMLRASQNDCLEHMEVEKEWRKNSQFSHLPLYEHRVMDWFDKNNFDYRGLIPMGLALDATELNIY